MFDTDVPIPSILDHILVKVTVDVKRKPPLQLPGVNWNVRTNDTMLREDFVGPNVLEVRKVVLEGENVVVPFDKDLVTV
jgi:hypothetical protein